MQFAGEDEAYFCPAGTNLSDRRTLISLTYVFEQLRACPAVMKTLLVDACRNDPQLGKGRGPTIKDLSVPSQVPGGVAALFSCSDQQQSFEHPKLGHGVFFHYVIEGLRGRADSQTPDVPADRIVTLPELEQYVCLCVMKFATESIEGRSFPSVADRLSACIPWRCCPGRATVAPPPLQAPFTLEDAERSQQGWAEFLGTMPLYENSLGMKLALIPPARFTMGASAPPRRSPPALAGSPGSFKASIRGMRRRSSSRFSSERHEVTVGQFRRFVEETGYVTQAEKEGFGYALDDATLEFGKTRRAKLAPARL